MLESSKTDYANIRCAVCMSYAGDWPKAGFALHVVCSNLILNLPGVHACGFHVCTRGDQLCWIIYRGKPSPKKQNDVHGFAQAMRSVIRAGCALGNFQMYAFLGGK